MIRVAKAAILKDEVYLFLKRRQSSTFFPEKWDFPGGKLEQDEEVHDCLKREVKEETALDIQCPEFVCEYECTEHGKIINSKLFLVKKFSGDVELSADHTEYRWFSKNELNLNDLTPFVKAYFKL